ncbi:MAG: ABC transporter permease [Kineosporiaceae bacterium]
MTATLVLGARNVRIAARQVDGIITAVVLPVLILVLFVFLFGGAIATGGDYVTYVVPGVLLICAGFTAASAAVAVTEDMSRGVIDRLRSLDVPAAAFLAAHVVTSLARNVLATTVVVGVAVAVGFRPAAGPGEWGAALGLVLAYSVAVSSLAAAIGLLVRTPEAANGATFLFTFLPYPSSAFVPVETMPGWLRGFAESQPLTPVIESVRGFLLGQPVGDAWWQALAWCAAVTAVSVAASGWLFRLRTR